MVLGIGESLAGLRIRNEVVAAYMFDTLERVPLEPWPFRDANSPQSPEVVWLPGGTFRMDSPPGVGMDSERPAHEVT